MEVAALHLFPAIGELDVLLQPSKQKTHAAVVKQAVR